MADYNGHTSARNRVLSNYIRLFVTFTAGLLIIRLMAEVGPSALVVYLLIIAGTGFAYFFKIVMQESVIPVLGLSFDEQMGRSFASVYWIAFLSSLVASAFALVIFAVIWLLAPYFDTGTIGPAAFGVAIISAVLRTIASAVATPPLNAVLITGRVVAYNIFLALERLTDLLAVVLVLVFWPEDGEDTRTMVFFMLSGGFYIALQIACYFYATKLDPRFRVHRTTVEVDDIRWVRNIFGWNTAVVVAFLLYLRFSTFLVNAEFGQGATLVLGIVFMLIGYQRQVAMGLVIGLDAVVARLYGQGTDVDEKKAAAVITRSTYVQGVFSFFSIAVLWVFAQPIFNLWLGSSLDGTGWDTEQAAFLFRIMTVGVLARSLSENWMKFLNGKGKVVAYAPYLLAGGVLNAMALVVMVISSWQTEQVLIGLAVIFAVLHVIVHLGILPLQVVRAVELPLSRLFGVLAVPGAASLVSAIIAVIVLDLKHGIIGVALALIVFCAFAVILILPYPMSTLLGVNKHQREEGSA